MVEVKGQSRRTFSVGEIAARAGVATSALRFYEANGLISSERTEAGHRRYHADVMRRVGLPGKAFVPMLSAHACAIPGIMATRVIENWRDRLREGLSWLFPGPLWMVYE